MSQMSHRCSPYMFHHGTRWSQPSNHNNYHNLPYTCNTLSHTCISKSRGLTAMSPELSNYTTHINVCDARSLNLTNWHSMCSQCLDQFIYFHKRRSNSSQHHPSVTFTCVTIIAFSSAFTHRHFNHMPPHMHTLTIFIITLQYPNTCCNFHYQMAMITSTLM